MSEASDQLIAQVGEFARATPLDGDEKTTPLICENCFGLIVLKSHTEGFTHASGLMGCADAIRAFVEQGADW